MAWLRRVLTALAAALVVLPAGVAIAQPNIVVIETDDQRQDEMSSLPLTRALIGREGLTFSRSIVSESQCCPSRATFQTGEYAHNHHVLSTDPPFGGFAAFDQSQSLSQWLQKAGYKTALVGKYFNQYGKYQPRYVPPGWDDWHAMLGPYVYRFFGFKSNDNGVVHAHKGFYETDTLTGTAEKIIRERAAGAQPFFLWLTYVAPHVGGPVSPFERNTHGSTVASPIMQNAFLGARMSITPAFDEADVSDKPKKIRARPRLAPREVAREQEIWRTRQQSLASVDQGVRRIVRALRQSGELKNTLLVFTSDNGFLLGEHRVRSGKVLPYEPSIRVPLLMRGPGVPKGATSRQLVWNGDLAPTILAAAGATAPWQTDGESLWPFIRHPRRNADRSIVLESPPNGHTDPTPRFTGLRTDRYTYVEWMDGEKELYDLERDPWELRNLAGRGTSAERRLAGRLGRLKACLGEQCRR